MKSAAKTLSPNVAMKKSGVVWVQHFGTATICVAALAICGCDQAASAPAETPEAAAQPRADAPAATLPLTCGAPSAAAAAGASTGAPAGGEAVEADTPGGNGTRLFALGKPVRIAFTTRTASADTLAWTIRDAWGTVKSSGNIAVAAGAATYTLTCKSEAAGYFAIAATLGSNQASKHATLPSRGTRPAGIATFGVLPDIARALPPVNYAHADQHRFGGQGTAYLKPGETCCSGDGYRPLYTELGLTWVNDNRNWYVTEPKAPNTFNPSADNVSPYLKPGDLLRLIQLDGIPGWANKTGKDTHSYAPASLAQYEAYMKKVGQESDRVRTKYFPTQSNNYYQVTWEPDYEGGLPWRDTDANLVAMYKATYEGIHASDPHAVVMGVTLAMLGTNTEWLKRLAPLGIAKYLDGISAHGYYDVGTSPSHPPERFDGDANAANAAKSLPASMRALRRVMADTMKPGAKLFITETGISYDIGSKYGASTPSANVLYAQGAVVARTHLILLGEGADVSFVFYAADPPEVGYGLFFDLVNAGGGFGQTQISPKPAALGVAAMTRLIDGTTTLGAVKDTPKGVYAYAFQRLNGGRIVTALWSHDNAAWPAKNGFDAIRAVPYSLIVDSAGTSGKVVVFDMMGNAATKSYANGRVELSLSEAPLYVVSDNAAAMRANVNAPAGLEAP